MTNRIIGRSEASVFERFAFVSHRRGTAGVPEAALALPAVEPLGSEIEIARELMRLECARQVIENDLNHLRGLQSGKVS